MAGDLARARASARLWGAGADGLRPGNVEGHLYALGSLWSHPEYFLPDHYFSFSSVRTVQLQHF